MKDCYTGNIDTDELMFLDLTGNGNDMIAASEGNGDQLDIFAWDTGTSGVGSTSLKFNNTYELAKIVDPYEAELTTYSSGYVSGKYLETVESAPINEFDCSGDWTIEVLFKVSSEWDNVYNRYCGVFSKQGVSEMYDEPFYSMALSEADSSVSSTIGTENPVGLQYIHLGGSASNKEFSSVKAEEWVHYMVVKEASYMIIYVNGEMVEIVTKNSVLESTDFGWEVGVGRKYAKSAVTMNPQHEEGLIGRLFCGSIAEIRISSAPVSIEASLLTKVL